jgi:hypothetical protein
MEIIGRTHHMLVSLWGKRWHKIKLVMLTLYIDDSGTAPSQHVAIATALIIPSAQIIRLEREWDTLKKKHGFAEFHTSIFVARNYKSEFAKWTDGQQDRLFSRIRQISKKYGVRAVSIAVNKKDYDEVVPPEMRKYFGQHHYSWAVRHLLANLDHLYPPTPTCRREFVFQWLERNELARKEIEEIMDQMQFISEKKGTTGDYSDPHFRKSADIPGLQCVDAVSWVSYQYALHLFKKTPLRRFVPESWKEFEGHLGISGWLRAVTIRRENLERSIAEAVPDPTAMQFFKEWEEYKRNKNEKKK